MAKNNDVAESVDYLYQIGWFKTARTPKEITQKVEEEFEIVSSNIIPTLKLKRFSGKIKKINGKWNQIRPPKEKGIKKTDNFNEIEKELGDTFKKEMNEFKIVNKTCSNCTAFLMRKIFEKLLFIILCKSDQQSKISTYRKTNQQLPNLTSLLNWSGQAEIKSKHIISPSNLSKIQGSKFLGDTSAHNYLTSVSFEDINNEISLWRITIKELASNL